MGTAAIVTSFAKYQIAQACRDVAPILAASGVPPGLDPAQLFWAISGNESSFGSNCAPRYERAFDKGGVYGRTPQMLSLLAGFGSAAAYSYGPWQMMFCNAPNSATPEGFSILGSAAQWSATFMARQFYRFKPQTISDVGEIWNAGHPMFPPSSGVARYVQELAENYAVPMPPVPGQ
jgi:hypothetical protein